jgi:3-oxoacyl-[acyl-carrier protein] reductase
MVDLAGRVAIVTGASRGIGAATATALADAGARVVLVHRDSGPAAEAVRLALPGAGHRVVQASITDSGALANLAEGVRALEGRLDVLVNNAGTSKVVPHADLDALDDALFDRIMATNVRGAFATVRACRALLDESGAGVIVNISSVAARVAYGSNIAYCASKAALEVMTMALARALAPKVRVLAVAPGLVDTEFTRSWDPAVRQRQIDATPLKRLATPEDVADTVLAAIGLTGTTGAVIPVDGGRPLGT